MTSETFLSDRLFAVLAAALTEDCNADVGQARHDLVKARLARVDQDHRQPLIRALVELEPDFALGIEDDQIRWALCEAGNLWPVSVRAREMAS